MIPADPVTRPEIIPAPLRPWLTLVGLALPFVALGCGWWLADVLAVGHGSDSWWDAASNCIYVGLIVALVVAVASCAPVLRRIERADQVFMAFVLAVAYFILLAVFNFVEYTRTAAPFP